MEISSVGGFSTPFQSASASARQAGGTQTLSAEEQREVQRLRQIDRQVRAHEQAHMAAAAGLSTGGASFQYVRGPDGRQYAVAGEVSISVSTGSTPEQTIERARRLQAAALAPADPSAQDRAVAAQAAQLEMRARLEAAQAERATEESGQGERGNTPTAETAGGSRDPDPVQVREALASYAAGGPTEPPPSSVFSLFA